MGITDALGNNVQNSYDDQGNVIETGYFLPSGTRTFRQRFDYQSPDRPGKLWKRINPDDSFFEYAYDAMGNLNQATDPAGKITTYSYDLLNRQVAVTRPGDTVTTSVYDGQGNQVLVTDPKSHTTEYVVDDLGRTVKINSPDAGTTVYTFDAAGDPVSKTDANNITSTYTYDAESRLTGIHYPDAAQDVAYTYDQGENGKGRLTGMTDQAGVYAYSYDPAGNLVREERTIEAHLYTTAYTYDAADVLTGITYPNGRTVAYTLDAAGRVSRVTTSLDGKTAVVADNLTYLPFGPLAGYDDGSGVHVDRTYDEGYRMTGLRAGSLMDVTYTRDPAGNVTGISNALEPSASQSFGHDDLYRLTSASGAYGTLGYTYDKLGNRLSKTENGQTDTYQYVDGTSRLQAIAGADAKSFTFDDAGNMTGEGARSYTYNQNNRLIRAADANGNLGEYVYSASGQRIEAKTDAGTTVFHYDAAGNLIGESNAEGDFIATYIYLGGLRLAAVAATPTSETTVTVATSQGTPLAGIHVYAFTESGAYTGKSAVTDSSGKAVFNAGELADGNYKFRADYLSDQFWSQAVGLPDTMATQIVIPVEAVTVKVTQAGAPKAGVKVYLFNEAGAYLGICATSDENGNVAFTLPAGQGYRFRADDLGSRFMSDVFTVSANGSNAFSVATGGGTLTISLEKQDQTPISGIKLYLFSASSSYLGLSGNTDTQGQVSFAVPSGTYKVRADYMGYQFWTDDISVTADKDSALVIGHREVTVTVQRDLSGDTEPAADTPVYLFTAAGSYVGVQEKTNENGKAVFDVPAGDYKVRADLFTHQYWSDVFNQSDAAVTIEDGTALVTVSGQGLPLTGVKVYAFNDQGAYLGLNAQTDSQGQVSFRLPAGKYDFRADYLGSQYFSGNTTLIAGTDNPVAISTGGGNLKLSVLKASGDPLAGLKCYLFSTAGAYLGQSRVTASDGTADFNLADGSYRVRVDYLGYQYWTDDFSVPDTAETQLTIAHKDVTVTVSGNESGDIQPKANVPVYLFTPEGAYQGVKVTTDADGKAVFSLPGKAYTVRADYLGGQFWSAPFTDTDTAVTIAEGTAAVTVTRGSDVLGNVKVYVFSASNAYLGVSAATDADGRVSFRLPAGTYKLRADYLGNQFWATATVTGDETSDIALSTGGGTFALTVQKQSGEALAGVPVYAFNSSGAYLGLTATTDAQGQVSFALADGDYSFRADYLGHQFWTPDETVPNVLSDVLAIAHRNVTVTVNQKYGIDLTPLENVPVYLFTADGASLGIEATTDSNGQVSFDLPAADYKVRADDLSSQTWSPVFNQSDAEVDIAFGKSTLHVISGGDDLFDAPVYLFTADGAYLGQVRHTDSSGLASFMVPAGAYKFRVDHNGGQAWSDVINILAGQETVTDLDLDALLSDLTLSPDPVRFDGTPPSYHPEKIMLASFGPLTGLLPATPDGQTTVDKLYYFINDQLGTPQIVTDDAGAVVWKADYRPFGAVDITVDKITNNLRFAGQYADAETGLHYNYNRYYDPATGRYLTPDPIGLDGGINLFAYTENNPINFLDPLGLFRSYSWQRSLVPGQVFFDNGMTSIENGNYGQAGLYFAGMVGEQALFALSFGQYGTAEIGGQCAASEGAYEIAEEGGKHAGFLKNNLERSTEELEKGISKLEKQIATHEDKIANPAKYIEKWNELDPRQQQALINKKWPSDIQRQIEQRDILQGILKNRN